MLNDTHNASGGGGGGSGRTSRTILGVYFTASVCTVIQCLFAVYISSTSARLRRRPSRYFSYSLVFSVGLLSGISMVFGAILLFVPGANYISIYGCFIRVIQRCLSNISCLMLTCHAFDRYVSICRPLRYFHLITEVRCGVLSAICWVLGFLLPILPCARQLPSFCMDGHSNLIFLISYTVVYNLSALSMFVFYILVTREFRRHPRREHHHNRDLAEAEALIRLKTARSALRVLVLYSLLSIPHMFLPLASRVFGWKVSSIVYNACHLLHRLHLLLFLPMYMWANADSHEALKASFKRICHKLSCGSECFVTKCICSVCSCLHEFFCCPSENNRSRFRLDNEFSQVSTFSTEFSMESKF